MAIPSPIVPAHMPTARARSPGSRNMSLTIDRPEGMVMAAPAPMSARQAMRGSTLPEKAAPREPPPKTTRPQRKSRLRPIAVGQAAGDEQ